jgi:hypothetical protein
MGGVQEIANGGVHNGTVNMAQNLLAKAQHAGKRLLDSARYVATDNDRQMHLAEVQCSFMVAKLRNDSQAMHEALRQLRDAPGATPQTLWAKAVKVQGLSSLRCSTTRVKLCQLMQQ